MRRVVAILVGALVLTLGLPLAFGQAVSTQAIRNQWSPPCAPGAVVVKFPSGAKISVDPRAGEAFGALAVTTEAFGYNVRPGDTGAYNCRRITGGSGYSLHAYKIAADLNWTTNFYGRRLVTDMPPAMTSAIKGIRTNSGQTIFRWGGDYSGNKDAMHFEIIVSPAVLASGVNWYPPWWEASGGRPYDRGRGPRPPSASIPTGTAIGTDAGRIATGRGTGSTADTTDEDAAVNGRSLVEMDQSDLRAGSDWVRPRSHPGCGEPVYGSAAGRAARLWGAGGDTTPQRGLMVRYRAVMDWLCKHPDAILVSSWAVALLTVWLTR